MAPLSMSNSQAFDPSRMVRAPGDRNRPRPLDLNLSSASSSSSTIRSQPDTAPSPAPAYVPSVRSGYFVGYDGTNRPAMQKLTRSNASIRSRPLPDPKPLGSKKLDFKASVDALRRAASESPARPDSGVLVEHESSLESSCSDSFSLRSLVDEFPLPVEYPAEGTVLQRPLWAQHGASWDQQSIASVDEESLYYCPPLDTPHVQGQAKAPVIPSIAPSQLPAKSPGRWKNVFKSKKAKGLEEEKPIQRSPSRFSMSSGVMLMGGSTQDPFGSYHGKTASTDSTSTARTSPGSTSSFFPAGSGSDGSPPPSAGYMADAAASVTTLGEDESIHSRTETSPSTLSILKANVLKKQRRHGRQASLSSLDLPVSVSSVDLTLPEAQPAPPTATSIPFLHMLRKQPSSSVDNLRLPPTMEEARRLGSVDLPNWAKQDIEATQRRILEEQSRKMEEALKPVFFVMNPDWDPERDADPFMSVAEPRDLEGAKCADVHTVFSATWELGTVAVAQEQAEPPRKLSVISEGGESEQEGRT
ncbi:hypothetical protein CYLTODRAFT_421908 [Cylindrobasidium torrendii FP15055 ss-10]|uniref:Uncharacterized protein n=1 Tax=Cylindrobasidium torrendii FP15055 ss-10 TaxID=1314674 RepID=A0A0D7BDA5_9AGAR|nr:hypothetical protein CYLTODRAFT_421908 [Cylindrobasidium torrendii FP15055 ss-10]